MDLPTSKR